MFKKLILVTILFIADASAASEKYEDIAALKEKVSQEWVKYGDSQLAWDHLHASPAKKQIIEKFIRDDIARQDFSRRDVRMEEWLAATRSPRATELAKEICSKATQDYLNARFVREKREVTRRIARRYRREQEQRQAENHQPVVAAAVVREEIDAANHEQAPASEPVSVQGQESDVDIDAWLAERQEVQEIWV